MSLTEGKLVGIKLYIKNAGKNSCTRDVAPEAAARALGGMYLVSPTLFVSLEVKGLSREMFFLMKTTNMKHFCHSYLKVQVYFICTFKIF